MGRPACTAGEPGHHKRAEAARDPEGCYIQGKTQDMLGGENDMARGVV